MTQTRQQNLAARLRVRVKIGGNRSTNRPPLSLLRYATDTKSGKVLGNFLHFLVSHRAVGV
jgi:hypothetical protein